MWKRILAATIYTSSLFALPSCRPQLDFRQEGVLYYDRPEILDSYDESYRVTLRSIQGSTSNPRASLDFSRMDSTNLGSLVASINGGVIGFSADGVSANSTNAQWCLSFNDYTGLDTSDFSDDAVQYVFQRCQEQD